MRDFLFTPIAFEQYNDWQSENKQIFNKLKKLIKETAKNPYEGTGKPEALKHDYKGYWSRRITDEHRLIYKVEDNLLKLLLANSIINPIYTFLFLFKPVYILLKR